MSKQVKNILIIDDHRLVADGLKLILSQAWDAFNITTSNSVRTVLHNEEILRQQDIILVDLHMPTIDGFGFLASFKKRRINVPVIIVSAADNREEIERVLRCGAMGFIPKNASSADMVNGINEVLNGRRFIPEHLIGEIRWQLNEEGESSAKRINVEKVRPRQMEVLKLMHAGYSNSDIGIILGLSESTVKTHVGKLFKLLNVKNRTACVLAAVEMKLI